MFRAQSSFLNETKVVLLDSNEQPFTFVIQRNEDINYKDIYQGRILKKIFSLKAFLVDIGKENPVFMASSHPLNEGDPVIVQVIKEARIGKEAQVSLLNTLQESDIGLIKKGEILTKEQLSLPEIPWNDIWDESLENALEPIISFADGAHLIIERTSAFWSLDVDSASSSMSFSDINEQVIPLIVQEIIKRNLNGNILIDLIGHKTIKSVTPLLNKMETLFSLDPVPTRILGLSRLGNIEIQRNRYRSALTDILNSLNSQAYFLFKSILNNPSPFLIISVSLRLYKHIMGPLAETWKLVQNKKGTRILLKANPTESSFTLMEK